ncbi:DDE-type integrase/transposase/recombinase [Plantactinospora solaniradicis]|uniref:DDE-type integrase/transposase/recombinase n=1 Tax=Plantactinospora solaniradicis TaxID=1723736 RepID=A0ABW1KIY1_9ACTN
MYRRRTPCRPSQGVFGANRARLRSPGRRRGPPLLPTGTADTESDTAEVVTDAAPVYPAVLDELVPTAWHHVERHANNPVEADHGQLKHRLRLMCGLRTDQTAQAIIARHAFMQNLQRGHYELGHDATPKRRVAATFTELARAI